MESSDIVECQDTLEYLWKASKRSLSVLFGIDESKNVSLQGIGSEKGAPHIQNAGRFSYIGYQYPDGPDLDILSKNAPIVLLVAHFNLVCQWCLKEKWMLSILGRFRISIAMALDKSMPRPCPAGNHGLGRHILHRDCFLILHQAFLQVKF